MESTTTFVLRCQWINCGVSCVDENSLHEHLCAAHIPITHNNTCKWLNCTTKFNLPSDSLTHFARHSGWAPFVYLAASTSSVKSPPVSLSHRRRQARVRTNHPHVDADPTPSFRLRSATNPSSQARSSGLDSARNDTGQRQQGQIPTNEPNYSSKANSPPARVQQPNSPDVRQEIAHSTETPASSVQVRANSEDSNLHRGNEIRRLNHDTVSCGTGAGTPPPVSDLQDTASDTLIPHDQALSEPHGAPKSASDNGVNLSDEQGLAAVGQDRAVDTDTERAPVPLNRLRLPNDPGMSNMGFTRWSEDSSAIHSRSTAMSGPRDQEIASNHPQSRRMPAKLRRLERLGVFLQWPTR
ncbi:hypothetical protein BKA62DRAFT_828330 [Auriculariales sp. MPI-PUGE-AT-0066]|nr:hypothetical protein BKA62DRAFT_828330 [Auriculariales sp. MPI-PUGE-AT-0066]